jgi:myo-inositol catabolism protein IolC
MDHRSSFEKALFGITGTPNEEQLAAMRDAKSVIFEAVAGAKDLDLRGGHVGVLVDEELGADIARKVKGAGFQLAMPVEISGSDTLSFQYGDQFGEHIEEFDPDWVKVLVRYNPADPQDLKTSQAQTLRRLHDWVVGARRRWLLELLVPATRKQLAEHDDQLGYDTSLRPSLTSTSIRELTEAGIYPSIWKLEGYETPEGATEVLETVKPSAGTRRHASSSVAMRRSHRWTNGSKLPLRSRDSRGSQLEGPFGNSRSRTMSPDERTGTRRARKY